MLPNLPKGDGEDFMSDQFEECHKRVMRATLGYPVGIGLGAQLAAAVFLAMHKGLSRKKFLELCGNFYTTEAEARKEVS